MKKKKEKKKKEKKRKKNMRIFVVSSFFKLQNNIKRQLICQKIKSRILFCFQLSCLLCCFGVHLFGRITVMYYYKHTVRNPYWCLPNLAVAPSVLSVPKKAPKQMQAHTHVLRDLHIFLIHQFT